MKQKITLLLLLMAACSVVAIAQPANGYYRVKNIYAANQNQMSYLNASTRVEVNPDVIPADRYDKPGTVFYLETQNVESDNQVVSLRAQGVDVTEIFGRIKPLLANQNELTFNIMWGLVKTFMSANEQINEALTTLGIDLDGFTYEEYKEWIDGIDDHLWLYQRQKVLFIAGYTGFYIKAIHLPEYFTKGSTLVEEGVNAALALLTNEQLDKFAALFQGDSDAAQTMRKFIYMLKKFKFGHDIYLVEDFDTGTLDIEAPTQLFGYNINLGDNGKWELESIDGDNYLGVPVDESIKDINGTYYTTYYTDFPYQLTDDMVAYYVDGIDRSGVANCVKIAEKGGKVPASTPVIITSTAKDLKQCRVVPLNEDVAAVSGNELSGSCLGESVNILVRTSTRTLGMTNEKVGFLRSSPTEIPANQCYYRPSLTGIIGGGTLSTITLSINPTPTGIDRMEADGGLSESNEPVYDLSGRRVTQPKKGIYIINGKKVVLK